MEALRDITQEIIDALAPLVDASGDPEKLLILLAELGWTPNSVPQPLQELAQAGSKLIATLDADPSGINAIEALDSIVRLSQAIDAIRNKPNGAFPSGIDLASFKATIGRDLLDYILVEHLVRRRQKLGGLLKLSGVVRLVQTPAVGLRQPFLKRQVEWNRISELFTDPVKGFREAFDWNSANPALDQVLADMASLLESYDLQFSYFEPEGDLLTFLNSGAVAPLVDPIGFDVAFSDMPNAPVDFSAGIKLILRPPTAGRGPALTFLPYTTVKGDKEIQLSDSLGFSVRGNADFSKGVALTLAPGQPPELNAGFLGGTSATPAEIQFKVSVKPAPGETERRLLGAPDASKLTVQNVVFFGGARFVPAGKLDTFAGIQIEKARAVVKPGPDEADSFVAKLLGDGGIEAELSFGLEVSSVSGFHVSGSGALEVSIPVHVTFGPIDFQALTLALKPKNGTMEIEAGATIAGKLGPLAAVVEGVGFKLVARFPDPPNGNLGPIDAAFAFKPPTAVGLSIDAGVIRGGGFLRIDPDRGEYAGNLELTFSEVISLKAIGLITTKMPDGSKGFSLLIIITAEFGTGIQLGFGFTLLGVGGLLGLNRTVQLQPLMEGIRTGAVESIMFPKDVITNAPKIISDLRIIFPPREGTFLIGPMAKLGWGTPTLISISLGIIIEIPGNIAILGILKIAIPADEIALIILQVNFAGAIEFDRKRLYFFAALFESRIVFLTIEGEMGLLVALGDDANFVVSVGGFHPRFNPPPLPFPSPKRIAVSLLNTPVSRLRIEGYFAVTSNTVQFGARVDVFFGLDEVNVQGNLQFDALFQFSPFFFLIEISASLSVNVFGIGLFSVRIRGSLDGPAPYHIKGHGSIGFFFFDVDVDFEETWGERRNTELPPIAVLPILQGEINKADNWRALLPAANSLLVSLRKMPTSEAALILHPLGVLEISQRALPLELKLDKVGTQKPSDVNRVSMAVTAGGLTKKDNAFAQFALAQYQNFSDSEKLSLPAFAPEKSGLKLSAAGGEVRSSQMVKRIVRYEEIIIDNNFKRFQRRFRGVFSKLFTMLLDGNAVSRAEVSASSKKRLQPFAEKIDVKSETYTVALQSNNTAFAADSISFHSEASARDYLNRKVAEDASLVDEIHVIPSFEMAA